MNYSPVTGVWEITMGCNMKCRHCGSSCTHALPGELTTEEALKLCDDIAGLGLMWITLSGGEPLIRKDWYLIVQRLRNNGVIPNLITNGWAVTEKVLETAKESGIGTLAVSLDGLESYHDYMRKPGAYRRGMNALRMMRDMDISAGVITTVSKKNLPELPAFKDALSEVGVRFWQLQIGLPMGNLKENSELIMLPEDVDAVIDFTYDTMLEGKINLYPADCLGYYNIKELKVRQSAHKTPYYPTWKGCNAGKRSLSMTEASLAAHRYGTSSLSKVPSGSVRFGTFGKTKIVLPGTGTPGNPSWKGYAKPANTETTASVDAPTPASL